MSDFKLDWATHEAAKYACQAWHYSGTVPSGKKVKIGLWENNKYKGVIIYSRGATPNIGSPFGLDQTEICELTRVAFDEHETPVSQCLSISISMLKKRCTGLRLIVSYADTEQKHLGTIYQAGNWYYLGKSQSHAYEVHGKRHHPKTLHSRYGEGGQSVQWLKENVDPNARRIDLPPKLKYAYPLEKPMRYKIQGMSKKPPDNLSADVG